MKVCRFCEPVVLAFALLTIPGCAPDVPRDHELSTRGGSAKAESTGSRPDASPSVSGIEIRSSDIAHLQAPPATFTKWRAQTPLLDVAEDGVTIGQVDHADPWIVIGDSIAVGFDRGISAARFTHIHTGAQLRVGRAGRGPLEFSALATLVRWSGDSVALIDRGLRRATILDVHRRAGRSFLFVDADTASTGEPLAALGDSSIVYQSRESNGERGVDGMYRSLLVLRVVESNTQRATVSATLHGPVGYRVPFGGGRIIGTAPVALAPLLAAGSDEVWWLPGGTDSLYAMGRLSKRLVGRVGLQSRHLTRGEKERLANAYLSRLSKTPEVAAATRRVVTIPDSIYPVAALWAGQDRTFWFRITGIDAERDDGSVWIQARRDGSIMRCFSIPSEKRILAFGRAIAIVATRDSSDDTFGVGVAKLAMGCPTSAGPFWK